MEKVKLYARAKINTVIDVVERLDNGYHNLEMIMQSVHLADVIVIKKTFTNTISLDTNIQWLPNDSKNLVYKTAKYLRENYKISYGIDIKLFKSIPICAGLAGGSSDCAATLIGIRNLFKLPISNDELLKIGKEFGADVPFCLKRGSYLAKGIGEKLYPITPFPHCYILIAKPNVNISTAFVFQNLNLDKIKTRPDIEKMIYYQEKQDLKGIADTMSNVLENVSIARYPIIQNIKDMMIKNGALGSVMSGSGSAVFGIFNNKKQMAKASKELRYRLGIKDIFATKPFNAIQ